MEYKESTIDEIIESEKNMAINAEEKYGEYYINALEGIGLLNHFIKELDDLEKQLFMNFLSQVKKHIMLAFLSAIRRHHIQTGMNLRQTLEASARMAYAIGNKEPEKFYKINELGLIEIPDKLNDRKNTWLDKNFKDGSNFIKGVKKHINGSLAHSKITYSLQNFKSEIDKGIFNFTFFDIHDELKIKTDLWRIGNTSLGLLDLFYRVNNEYKTFKVIDNFLEVFQETAKKNDELKNKLLNESRIKKHIKNK